jgi:hypothetical protein
MGDAFRMVDIYRRAEFLGYGDQLFIAEVVKGF